MRIHPVCFVCPRDWPLFELLANSLTSLYSGFTAEPFTIFHDRAEPLTFEQFKFCTYHPSGRIQILPRLDGFYPWNGWVSPMSKLDAYRTMCNNIADDNDYVMYCDSDLVFFNLRVMALLGLPDFVGFAHDVKTYVPRFKEEWSWYSGCLQFLRVGALRRACALKEPELEKIRQEMLDCRFSHNEDVVISYLMRAVNALCVPILPGLIELHPQDVIAGTVQAHGSVAHLNGNPETWLGIPIQGKWEIPMAIKKAGIAWP